MRNYPHIGIQAANILLPQVGVDLEKWAVIACDQFTSQPAYWQQAAALVGEAPSTLNLILPEVYLGTEEEAARIHRTQAAMRRYLQEGLLEEHEGLVYVEREVDGKLRRGIMLALDLEQYDFSKGSQSLIRATEGTIIERLPPRVRIRQGAPLELPHILVLIDDPDRTVIEPLADAKGALRSLYDTRLMQGSGEVRGWLVDDPAQEQRIVRALERLADPARFRERYGVGAEKGVLLFAVGDGNHSLATAKSIWEQLKPEVGPDHPARYALVEVENVHDDGLAFEPIHRVLFDVRKDVLAGLTDFFGDRLRFGEPAGFEQVVAGVDAQAGAGQSFGLISSEGASVVTVTNPPSNLPVGTLQAFLDRWLKAGGAASIDYVHGEQVVRELGSQPGHLGFYLPAMQKSDLFQTVILDGSLPRKTFSMGEAHEKRFYMEARKISEV